MGQLLLKLILLWIIPVRRLATEHTKPKTVSSNWKQQQLLKDEKKMGSLEGVRRGLQDGRCNRGFGMEEFFGI